MTSLTPEARAASLNAALADTYTLYLKTQNFHWNVTGALFAQLHELFGKQYEELAERIDVLAEQIRALGGRALGGLDSFRAVRRIGDAPEEALGAAAMIAELLADHLSLKATLTDLIDHGGFPPDTADALTEQLSFHSKCAWMLSASAS